MPEIHVCVLSCFSRVQLCATLRTAARQTPLSMGFFRQEYWSGLPHPPTGDLLDPGIKPASLKSNLLWQAGSLSLMPLGEPMKSINGWQMFKSCHSLLNLQVTENYSYFSGTLADNLSEVIYP